MPVAQSSNLQSYEYDPHTQTLTVQFVNGAVYSYAGVPEAEFYNLAQSGGAGTYFASKIRDRYHTTKLADGVTKGKRR